MSIDIKRWMSIAKKHGAIFNNIDFELDEYGVKAVAIDRKKEFAIKMPSPLLLPREAIELKEDKHYVLDAFVKDKELRDFFNEYLDFILSPKRIGEREKIILELNRLSPSLKEKISSFGVNIFKKMSRVEIKNSLIGSRTISKESKITFMPFIDFLNHNSKDGIGYTVTKGSILVKGFASKSGEIFAYYNGGDAFSFLNTYFFPNKSLFAYSMGINIQLNGGKTLHIGKDIKRFNIKCKGLRVPEYINKNRRVELSALWLGSVLTPRKPFWSFQKLFEDELGRDDSVKIFSIIKSFNISRLVEILEELDALEQNSAVTMLKEVALWQIKVIGGSFEDLNEKPC